MCQHSEGHLDLYVNTLCKLFTITHKEDAAMVTTQILAKVEAGRLGKAVEGLCSGAYAITVTGQGEQEIRGFVRNGDGI